MKEWSNKFNPFNSDKLFAHLHRWENIQRNEEIPPPVLVTIDPTNRCNLNCIWCNSKEIQKSNPKQIDSQVLNQIAYFLGDWEQNGFGVKSVCIAGGGEPTNHPYFNGFINDLKTNNLAIGTVTNATNIKNNLEGLSECDWVGASIDAGTPETFYKLKGVDRFDKVISGLKELIDYSKKDILGLSGQGHGVSYKFLLHPENIKDVFKSAQIAKEIGCRNLHIRPYGDSWFGLDKLKNFSYSDIQEFREQLNAARTLEDDNFKVMGITHKFDGDFRKQNGFKNCYAIFMTCVFEPPSKNNLLDIGFCCDRRGDDNLRISLNDPKQLKEFWGSKKHWEMFDKIKPKSCPRCTYQPHNQIFEKAIKLNNMTYDFI